MALPATHAACPYAVLRDQIADRKQLASKITLLGYIEIMVSHSLVEQQL